MVSVPSLMLLIFGISLWFAQLENNKLLASRARVSILCIAPTFLYEFNVFIILLKQLNNNTKETCGMHIALTNFVIAINLDIIGILGE